MGKFVKEAPIPLLALIIAFVSLLVGEAALWGLSLTTPAAVDANSVQVSPLATYAQNWQSASESLATTEGSSQLYKNMLDEDSQAIYERIEGGLRSAAERIDIGMPADASRVAAVAEAVVLDNPDIFWANGSWTVISDKTGNAVLLPQYSEAVKGYETKMSEYDGIAENMLESPIARLLSDGRYKMLWVIWSISESTSHGDETDAGRYQNIDSVFSTRESVCMGYAKGTCYIARKAGIPCAVVQGTAMNSQGQPESHAWVVAYIDGQVMFYDPYWFDLDFPLAHAWRWTSCRGDDDAFLSTHVCSIPQIDFQSL